MKHVIALFVFALMSSALSTSYGKKRLLNNNLNNLSFLGLAKDCGFNSEASFYRIFKKTVGLTPKQYLEKHTSNS